MKLYATLSPPRLPPDNPLQCSELPYSPISKFPHASPEYSRWLMGYNRKSRRAIMLERAVTKILPWACVLVAIVCQDRLSTISD